MPSVPMATLMMLTYPILQGRRDRRRGWRRSPVECPLAAAEWHDEEGQGSSPGPSAHLLFTCVKQNIKCFLSTERLLLLCTVYIHVVIQISTSFMHFEVNTLLEARKRTIK